MKTKLLSPTPERVHSDNFHFHDTAPLEFDLYQNWCEIWHTYYTYGEQLSPTPYEKLCIFCTTGPTRAQP
jgi:hypothetical protein